MEDRFEVAPHQIETLKHENSGLQKKLKETYAALRDRDRKLRSLGESLEICKSELNQLHDLIENKDLRSRHDLQHDLDKVNGKLAERDVELMEWNRKCDLLQKNLSSESKNLRFKIMVLDNEKFELQQKNEQLQISHQDKDREIASLFVYKYNSLHKKPVPCPECQKRKQQEAKQRKIQKILQLLPKLMKPKVTILENKIEVFVDRPEQSETCNYDKIEVHCLQKDVIQKKLYLEKTMFENLIVGEFCHVTIIAFKDDIQGEPSPPETVMLDVIPQAPSLNVSVQANSRNPLITLQLKESQSFGTKTTAFKLYHQIDNEYLLCEISTDVYSFKPQIAVAHYFRATAVNRCGESQKCNFIGPIELDFVPEKPPSPLINRHGARSVRVCIVPPKSLGESAIHHFKVVCCNLGNPNPVCSNVVASVINHVLIENLEYGIDYVFAVSAENKMGWSHQSKFSEPLCLENMLPTPPPPQCIISSPQTIKVVLHSAVEQSKCPTHTGFKLWVGRSELSVLNPFIPANDKIPPEYIMENLDYGGSYYIAVSLVGVSQESNRSSAVWVCLAAAIPLPRSPVQEPRAISDNMGSLSGSLNSIRSQSVDLSINQKVNNMYKGNPAFALPEELRSQGELEGIQFIVNKEEKRSSSTLRRDPSTTATVVEKKKKKKIVDRNKN